MPAAQSPSSQMLQAWQLTWADAVTRGSRCCTAWLPTSVCRVVPAEKASLALVVAVKLEGGVVDS
jgi:hypothetical protein